MCHPLWLLLLSRLLKENSEQGHEEGKVLEDEASNLPECPAGLLSRERVPVPLYRERTLPSASPLTSRGGLAGGGKKQPKQLPELDALELDIKTACGKGEAS